MENGEGIGKEGRGEMKGGLCTPLRGIDAPGHRAALPSLDNTRCDVEV